MSKKPEVKRLPMADQAQVAIFGLFLRQVGPLSEAQTEAGKARIRAMSPGVRAWALGQDSDEGAQ